MAKIPIGLQLYSVRNDCAEDLPRVLAAVARMGYAGVEFAGYHNRSASELRQMLDDHGLQCCGTHTPFDSLLGEALKRTVEFHLELGNLFLIAPSLPAEYRSSRDAWLLSAELFNGIAQQVKPFGLLAGYHNHWVEFTPVDGELPWDTFFHHTTADVVMQLDTGNALRGGAKAQPILERYPGRAKTVHLKEHNAANENALIGEGDVNWNEVFQLCETIGGTEWYIVEQESGAYPPLECVDRCLQALRAMGK